MVLDHTERSGRSGALKARRRRVRNPHNLRAMFVLIGDVAVLKRLSAFAVMSAFLALSVAQAVAQQTQQPQGPPWYGPRSVAVG